MKKRICYHCHENDAADHSVFCTECAPAPGALPPIIAELENDQTPKDGWLKSWLRAIFRPHRSVIVLAEQNAALSATLADCQQANKSLRRRCQSLKEQNAVLDEVLRENDTYRAGLLKVQAERDALRADLARISNELGLPPTVGPAPGYLHQLQQDYKNLLASYQHASRELADLRAGLNSISAELENTAK